MPKQVEVIGILEYRRVRAEDVVLEGPFECPNCNGHISFDATYIEQNTEQEYSLLLACSYCGAQPSLPEDNEKEP